MGTAVLVIVLVGAGESGSDWAAGMLQALREALDRSVVVDVRERSDPTAPPADAYVLSIDFAKNRLGAQLTTRQPPGRAGKDVSFKKSDRPLDRGRAIGYALAALLPELRADAIGPDVSAAAPTLALHAFLPVSDYVPHPTPTREVVRVTTGPAPAPAPPRAAFEVAAAAATYSGSDAAFGGSLTAQLGLGKGVSLRTGAFAVYGGSPLSGSALWRAGGRLGFRLAALTKGPFALSLGAGALAQRVEVTMAAQTLGRWVPGAEGSVELALCVSRVALFLAPTFQWAFGPTTLSLQGARAATVPEQLMVVEVGLRWWP